MESSDCSTNDSAQPLASAAALPATDPAVQHRHLLPTRQGGDLPDLGNVHQTRPMDPDELSRRKPSFNAADGLAHEIDPLRGMNQAWIGGTVASITSPDSADQSLVGVDMWWRMIDNGRGPHAAPDSTTGVGFAFPGSTITAESWCADQPAVLIMREVERGGFRIKSN